jgi:hypothetical protein
MLYRSGDADYGEHLKKAAKKKVECSIVNQSGQDVLELNRRAGELPSVRPAIQAALERVGVRSGC